MQKIKRFITAAILVAVAVTASAYRPLQLFPRQSPVFDIFRNYSFPDSLAAQEADETEFDEWGFPVEPAEEVVEEFELQRPSILTDSLFILNLLPEPVTEAAPIQKWEFTPIVYSDYIYRDSALKAAERQGLPDTEAVYGWLDNHDGNHRLMRQMQRGFIIDNPQYVKYNMLWLPEPPKHYHATIDPLTSQITLTEEAPKVSASQASGVKLDIDRRNWLSTFNALLQFSQAYVSPNWYQGGNNNLNMIADIYYNIKLNQAFHKNTMFETTIRYKLGLNSAPDDSLRSYSISEDLFQINSKFGLRAAKRWYYSLQLAFKTQLLNSYASNTKNLKSALLSPGELNVGVGMTYNYANPKKTFTFNASIAPISWNMKTCINSRMNETQFGIKEGHTTVSDYGSTLECTLSWQISYNIKYSSRLFAFTDYDYFQGDWEHTLAFDINRFLSTQIYAHMRYDTTTPRSDESEKWHKFQFKEILSIGFSYKFSTK